MKRLLDFFRSSRPNKKKRKKKHKNENKISSDMGSVPAEKNV